MKALLIGEFRDGRLLGSTYEPVAFAQAVNAEAAMFLVGREGQLPAFDGKVFLADAEACGEYGPEAHKALLLQVIEQEKPDLVVFSHSSYGWDLAPRLAAALGAAQISEVVGYQDGAFVVPVCNAKLRRFVKPRTPLTVITLQAGAFGLAGDPVGKPTVERLEPAPVGRIEFVGYEAAEKTGIDLGKAEVIVSAGRGVGKKDNIEVIAGLAKAMGGELGASRPVVDAGWVEHSRQVGTTGQTVSPKLYVACGISGAIQHLAGMKKSAFVVAINKDKDAPIAEVADVLVVADVLQLASALTEKVKSLSR